MTSTNTSPGLIDLGGYGLIISPISITQRNYYLRIIMTSDQIEALRILSEFDRTYDDPEYQEMNERAELMFLGEYIAHRYSK